MAAPLVEPASPLLLYAESVLTHDSTPFPERMVKLVSALLAQNGQYVTEISRHLGTQSNPPWYVIKLTVAQLPGLTVDTATVLRLITEILGRQPVIDQYPRGVEIQLQAEGRPRMYVLSGQGAPPMPAINTQPAADIVAPRAPILTHSTLSEGMMSREHYVLVGMPIGSLWLDSASLIPGQATHLFDIIHDLFERNRGAIFLAILKNSYSWPGEPRNLKLVKTNNLPANITTFEWDRISNFGRGRIQDESTSWPYGENVPGNWYYISAEDERWDVAIEPKSMFIIDLMPALHAATPRPPPPEPPAAPEVVPPETELPTLLEGGPAPTQ